MSSIKKTARIAGLFYLGHFATFSLLTIAFTLHLSDL
jgi:hypothetical protein